MENLTQKERIDLESVFAAICTKKEPKFLGFYKDFYSSAILKFYVVKDRIKKNKNQEKLVLYYLSRKIFFAAFKD